jgi:CubicO group peptidase (beta-lactamase class C family)
VTIDPAGPDGWQAMVDEAAFETGLWCDPSGGYSYATASIHLVSVLIRQATGMELEQFVRERIGQPLGWQPFTYGYKDSPLKHTPGGGGICLRATDWARFGYLLLNKGMWNGRQVVPGEYVRQAATASPYNPHYAYSLQFDVNTNGHYPGLPRDAFWKGGSGGHVVYVVPSRDLVVVKLGGRDSQYATGNTGMPEAPVSDANPEKPSVDSREATVETLRRVLALAD